MKPATEARGWLLYLKSSLTGDEPADVIEYRSGNPDFPHQSTGDQFFSESQFESYRRLGLHILREAFEGGGARGSRRGDSAELIALFQALTRKWYAPIPVSEAAAEPLGRRLLDADAPPERRRGAPRPAPGARGRLRARAVHSHDSTMRRRCSWSRSFS